MEKSVDRPNWRESWVDFSSVQTDWITPRRVLCRLLKCGDRLDHTEERVLCRHLKCVDCLDQTEERVLWRILKCVRSLVPLYGIGECKYRGRHCSILWICLKPEVGEVGMITRTQRACTVPGDRNTLSVCGRYLWC